MSRFIAEFHKDMEALGCLAPAAEPQATQYVPQMVRTIQAIVGKGHAYESGGDVLFAVDSIEGYGRLSGRSLVHPSPPPLLPLPPFSFLFFQIFWSKQYLSQPFDNASLVSETVSADRHFPPRAVSCATLNKAMRV